MLNSDIPTQVELDYCKSLEKVIKMMEELANAPKEEMGKREPGERGMYERQNLERATAQRVAMGTGLYQDVRKEEK